MTAVPDPIAAGLARGWHAYDASRLASDIAVDTDVVIVGTGAGGGTAAEVLRKRGHGVILVEEGPLASSSDFHMRESEAYPNLYQESAGRRTADKGILILQGRSVGGSTTVNWTTSLRTPPAVLDYWGTHFGLNDYSEVALEPFFAEREARLNVRPWPVQNENNGILLRGARKLGIATSVVPRNVKGCRNLGYCDLGCPVNAKQSMLVTTIPAALDAGAVLYSRLRADAFVLSGDRVTSLTCSAIDAAGVRLTGRRVTIRAKVFVAAGGAIGSPALLLRSGMPDPYGVLGTRTFLHPTVISAAQMPQKVDGFSGAPQSIYSDHFLGLDQPDGPIGYKLEVPPLHPVLVTTSTPGLGSDHARLLAGFDRLQVTIALMRDGFRPDAAGGTVRLRKDGSPVLDYAITAPLWDGMQRALVTMAEIQFAAGARGVLPLHESATIATTLAQAKTMIGGLPLEILRLHVASAHVMGGCGMGADPRTSVVDGSGRHHQVRNVYAFDGSVFPTSLGANPQLSIFAIVARNAELLARELA